MENTKSTDLTMVFADEQFGEVRTVMIDNEPWFVASDVCRALDLSDTGRAVGRLEPDESTRIEIDHPQSCGKKLEVIAVNEPGLYSLVLGSRKPEAKAFKRWITHEVIPEIRKRGVYATDKFLEQSVLDPDYAIGILTALKQERDAKHALELEVDVKNQQLAELQPKATYYDQVLNSKKLVPISVIAKDYGLSGQELNQILKEEKIQFKHGQLWLLYAEYASKGYTQSETYVMPNGGLTMHTKWTQAGRLFIYHLLQSRGILPIVERS